MILTNCAAHFIKLVPSKPNTRMDPKNPKWEIQLRTTDKEKAKSWKEGGLSVKPVLPDDGAPYWRINLTKPAFKKDKASGEMVPAKPVDVVDGRKKELDPATIGNGSIVNVRIFQYPYKDKATGKEKLASMLMAVQVIRHIVYVPAPREDFGECDTEVIAPPDEELSEDDDLGSPELY